MDSQDEQDFFWNEFSSYSYPEYPVHPCLKSFSVFTAGEAFELEFRMAEVDQ